MTVAIITSEKLAQNILSIVRNKGMSYLDAVLYFCEQREIEPERIAGWCREFEQGCLLLKGISKTRRR